MVERILKPLSLLLLVALVTLAVGWISLLEPVKRVDVALFDLVVPALQRIPGLVFVSSRVTDLGALKVNYGMVIALAALLVARAREYRRAGVLALIFLSGLAIQLASIELLDGFSPTEHVIGVAGPYFSGGVMRVIVVAGLLLRVACPQEALRRRMGLAAIAGLVEAITRLVLGRHWPIDILASFPIGLSLIAIHDQIDVSLARARSIRLRSRPTSRVEALSTRKSSVAAARQG